MIRSLAEEVQSALRSGFAIGSVGQCVEELLLNSIDARATCVAVRINMETLRIQVVDNGCGLCQEDMESIGLQYFTSKCHSLKDLEDLKFYGFRGEAIASIANMSNIVEISSKNKTMVKTFTKLFQNGKARQVQEAEVSRPSAGTTVTVGNLFYNLPVRRKYMDHVLEFERTRQRLEAVSLVHPSISFSLKNDAAHSVVLQLSKTRDVCSRFCQIYGLPRSQKLREIKHKQNGFDMSGYISCESHYNKTMQFLYVNNRLVLKTNLHKLIDFILRKESVICRSKGILASKINTSPGKHRSGPEVHGIFVINIQCNYCEYDVCLEPTKTLIEFQDWSSVLLCIEEGVKTFLKRENLFLEPSKEDIAEFNERNNFSLSCSEFQHVEEQDQQEAFRKACDSVIDAYEMPNLTSKSVCRKNTVKTHLLQISANLHKYTNEIQTTPGSHSELHDAPLVCTAAERDATETTASKGHNVNMLQTYTTESHKDTVDKSFAKDNVSHPTVCSESSESPRSALICKVIVDEALESGSCVWKQKENAVPETFNLQSTGAVSETSLSNTYKEEDRTVSIICDTPVTAEPCLQLIHVPIEREGPLTVVHSSSKTSSVNEQEISTESATHNLCCTGLITHVMPSLTSDTRETNPLFTLFSRPGPVSAMEIFENKILSAMDSQIRSKDLNKAPYTINTVEVRNQETAGLASSSKKRDEMTALCKSSSNVTYTGSNSTINTSKRSVSRRLSLFAQLGSLERFKRYYGKGQCSAACSSALDTTSPCKTSSQHGPELSKNQNNRLELIHCNKTMSEKPSHSTDYLQPNSAENSPQTVTEKVVITEADGQFRFRLPLVREQNPPTLSDYAKLQLNASGERRICSPLSAKLCKLKDNMTKASYPEGTKLRKSPRKDVTSNDLVNELSKGTVTKSIAPCSDIGKRDHATTIGTVPSNALNIPEVQSIILSQHTEIKVHDTPALDPPCEGDKRSVVFPARTSIRSSEEDPRDVSSPEANDSVSSDWLQCYDESLGRIVFINKATGLSSYTAPREEANTACTNDITTMAVNVVCSNDGDNGAAGSMQSLFSEWENPVFARFPAVAVDVGSGQADTLAVKIHNILYPYRFTKQMIHSMKVLQQVDNKFIACLMNTKKEESAEPEANLLVLVDQHAAHERIRLEQLVADSYEPVPGVCGRRRLKVSVVSPPLELDVTEEQHRLLRVFARSLQNVGLSVLFPDCPTPRVLVGEVPMCFVEREANEVHRGRSTVAKSLVEEFLREQVELLQTAGGAHGTFPLTVLKVLASQACHGAVKFNDRLSLEECRCLVQSLSGCLLPFQCAHGRPSVLPLADMRHLELGEQVQLQPNLRRLRRLHRAWELYAKEPSTSSTLTEHLSSSNPSLTEHLPPPHHHSLSTSPPPHHHSLSTSPPPHHHSLSTSPPPHHHSLSTSPPPTHHSLSTSPHPTITH
ncbi:DNA mismatch repair protein Mlh3 isoform X3 [Ascaphus truei]|uniref:DNA mismatch repair protein Mlh3 isoform X3 n=1 Tax=Ascaphus truei TaxID=8439 RepID=UPI003F5ABB62